MTDNFIQVKHKEDVLKIVLKDENGNVIKDDKNEDVYLEFDMADIELPLKLNKCEADHRKNVQYVQMKFTAIDKKEDKKGKYILSKNQEEKMNILKEFFIKDMESLDLFLGEGGTKKMLNGRKPYWGMFEDISEMLEPILPKLQMSAQNIEDKIRQKYSNKKEDNVIE